MSNDSVSILIYTASVVKCSVVSLVYVSKNNIIITRYFCVINISTKMCKFTRKINLLRILSPMFQ